MSAGTTPMLLFPLCLKLCLTGDARLGSAPRRALYPAHARTVFVCERARRLLRARCGAARALLEPDPGGRGSRLHLARSRHGRTTGAAHAATGSVSAASSGAAARAGLAPPGRPQRAAGQQFSERALARAAPVSDGMACIVTSLAHGERSPGGKSMRTTPPASLVEAAQRSSPRAPALRRSGRSARAALPLARAPCRCQGRAVGSRWRVRRWLHCARGAHARIAMPGPCGRAYCRGPRLRLPPVSKRRVRSDSDAAAVSTSRSGPRALPQHFPRAQHATPCPMPA